MHNATYLFFICSNASTNFPPVSTGFGGFGRQEALLGIQESRTQTSGRVKTKTNPYPDTQCMVYFQHSKPCFCCLEFTDFSKKTNLKTVRHWIGTLNKTNGKGLEKYHLPVPYILFGTRGLVTLYIGNWELGSKYIGNWKIRE